jgi:hypothetical protein
MRQFVNARPLLFLLLLTTACLVPFLGKPFHIDDPFWVRTAQQIQKHPLDPYGYRINWFGHEQPAPKIVQAPPLFSCLLAGWGKLFGLGEISCHAFNLMVALLAVAGIYFLALELGCDPFATTALSIATPVFMMSSSIVMSDLLMLTTWIWSLCVWLKAQVKNSSALYATATAFACACVLTKYNGVLLLGVLLAAHIIHYRKPNTRLLWLVVPCAALSLFLWTFMLKYGENPLSVSATYIELGRSVSHQSLRLAVTGLVFASAIVAAGFPFLFRSLGRWEVLICAAIAVGAELARGGLHTQNSAWLAQHALWLFGGLGLAWIAMRETMRRKDPVLWLLGVWLGLTFCFALCVNWTVNGRGLITIIPAVGLLLTRIQPDLRAWPRARVLAFLSPALLLSLLVARADMDSARIARRSAEHIAREFKKINSDGRTLWFEGHWGFQYYMEKGGGRAVDMLESGLRPGDILAVPVENSNIRLPEREMISLVAKWLVPAPLPVSVMNTGTSAGYYASSWGGLPFVLGLRAADSFYIFMLRGAQRGIA